MRVLVSFKHSVIDPRGNYCDGCFGDFNERSETSILIGRVEVRMSNVTAILALRDNETPDSPYIFNAD